MRLRIVSLVLLIGVAAPAAADTITIINNGLAPPNPANVIDSPNGGDVYVQNVGCDATVEWACPMPWGDPTSVELVAGGSVGSFLVAFESSGVTMSNGSAGQSLLAYDSSSITMSGGSAAGDLATYDSASVTMSGGSVGLIFATGSSSVTMSGGSVMGELAALDSSSVTMSGGHFVSDLIAAHSSTVRIIGTGFAVDAHAVRFGPIAATSGTLTGTLASGEPIDNHFTRSATALITLLPGPNNVVINNGLAPPNPANVFDAGNSFPEESVLIEDVGCDAVVEFPCAMPWGDPTSVELVAGGLVGRDLAAFETSSLTMSGGSVGQSLLAYDSSSLTMSGGSAAGDLATYDSASVTMSGGLVAGDLATYDSASITMSGGSVAGDLATYDSSSVTMSGGSVMGELAALDSSSVTMSGGHVVSDLIAAHSSTVRIIGTGFAVDGVLVDFGPIAATYGTVTGTLKSGEPIDNRFFRIGGTIALVPEPDAALLSIVAALSLAAVQRLRAS
jgi:hypothetical protein